MREEISKELAKTGLFNWWFDKFDENLDVSRDHVCLTANEADRILSEWEKQSGWYEFYRLVHSSGSIGEFALSDYKTETRWSAVSDGGNLTEKLNCLIYKLYLGRQEELKNAIKSAGLNNG